MGPEGPHMVTPGTGGGGPPPSMDLPRRGVAPGRADAAMVAAGGTGPVVVGGAVPGGGWPGGPLRRGRGGRADTFLGRGGGGVSGGRRGSGVERLEGGAAIPCAGAVRARGVVARWGRVVGSGSGGLWG